MQIKLRVQLIDGRDYQVDTNLFTIVALERKFKIRASDLEHGIAAEHLAYMAYEASKQQDIVVPIVFDDFIKTIAALDVVGGETPNPTDAAQ